MANDHSTIASVDPRTATILDELPADDATHLDAVVARAAALHEDGVLRPLATRAALLRACANEIEADRPRIVATCDAETGLGEVRLNGELSRTTGQLRAFADVVERGEVVDAMLDAALPDATPPRPDVRRMEVPIGPVAVFGASNFPLAFGAAGGDTASALAAGCPVVIKAHPAHPATGRLVAEALRRGAAEAGLPEDVVGHVLTAELDLAERLVDAEPIAAVGFTGSFEGGAAITRRAALRPRPIPVYAEMGSINPVVVTPAAARARAGAIASALAPSLAGNAGQLCTKPNLILVPDDADGRALVDELASRLGEAPPQPLLNERLCAAVGVDLEKLDAVAGLERATPAVRAPGYQRVFGLYTGRAADVASEGELWQEHFGPVAIALTYAGEGELLDLLQQAEGQLTATLHAEEEDGELAALLSRRLAAISGRVVFDGVPTGVAVTRAMVHGGPWPATSAPATTSVGLTAHRRFTRPVAFQDAPAWALPPELQDGNPLGIVRREAE